MAKKPQFVWLSDKVSCQILQAATGTKKPTYAIMAGDTHTHKNTETDKTLTFPPVQLLYKYRKVSLIPPHTHKYYKWRVS